MRFYTTSGASIPPKSLEQVPPQLKVIRRGAAGVERVGNGEGYPLPSRLGGPSWAHPTGSRAEPWRKTNFVHSKHHRALLVARYCKSWKQGITSWNV